MGLPDAQQAHIKLTTNHPYAMKKTLCAAALTLGLTGSSCLGPNNAYNSILNWNAELSEVDALNEIVFIAMIIIPVYPIAQFVDIIVFNTIDYWAGGHVISDPGPFPGFSLKGDESASE